jgi:hypothetical protein
MTVRFALLAIVWIVSVPTFAKAQPTLETLLKQCGEQTIVMGYDESGKPVQVGKHIDGYCSGFLEGALAILLRSGAICLKEGDAHPTAEFLLSIVETYRADAGSAENDLALLVEIAFRRAFRCAT